MAADAGEEGSAVVGVSTFRVGVGLDATVVETAASVAGGFEGKGVDCPEVLGRSVFGELASLVFADASAVVGRDVADDKDAACGGECAESGRGAAADGCWVGAADSVICALVLGTEFGLLPVFGAGVKCGAVSCGVCASPPSR